MSRGYACVGLYNSKHAVNVGSVLRAAGCFRASMVAVHGRRYQKASTDTMAAFKHLPLIEVEDLRHAQPYDCVPVAVEICEGAKALPEYKHPERAYYVFGPEDGSLPRSVIDWCRDVVYVPSGCLNLAATVNVVLYDRLAKRGR